MKEENKIIDGKLRYDDKEYCFNYVNNIITLYPKELEEMWKSFTGMFIKFGSKKEENTINLFGETRDGNPIAFIKLTLNAIGRGIYRSFVPAYIIGNCNAISPLPEINDFKRMVFKGECIDRIYNPKRLLKGIGHTKKLKPSLKFYDSKEMESKMIINEDTWKFNIGWNIPHKDINTVMTVISIFSINFKDLKNIDEIIDYYIKVEKVMGFLNNRKHVIFSEINLYKDIKFYDEILHKVRKASVAFHLYIAEKNDMTYDLSDKQISILDITNHIESLYNEIDKNPFIENSLPYNTYQANHVDNDSFIKITSAFEAEFDRAFKDYKSSTNADYKRIKRKVLEYINNCRDGEKGKNIKYIDKFYDSIDNLEGTLPEQICFALKRYTKPLERIKQRLFVYYNITNIRNGQLAEIFTQKRNSIAHGREIKEFTDIEVVGYILIERLVYCIILERVGFSMEEITNIVEKIFYK